MSTPGAVSSRLVVGAQLHLEDVLAGIGCCQLLPAVVPLVLPPPPLLLLGHRHWHSRVLGARGRLQVPEDWLLYRDRRGGQVGGDDLLTDDTEGGGA